MVGAGGGAGVVVVDVCASVAAASCALRVDGVVASGACPAVSGEDCLADGAPASGGSVGGEEGAPVQLPPCSSVAG